MVSALVFLVGFTSCQQLLDGARAFEVGSRTLWLDCRGRGSPTVLLEAGHTEASGTWSAIQEDVASFTRVCSYDRAGRGQSPPAPDMARTSDDVVADLRSLLSTAGEPPPFILVGHSLGALFVRRYCAAEPAAVVGMALVDGVHEEEFERIDALLTPEQRAAGAGLRPMSPENFDIEAILKLARDDAARPPAIPVVVIARGLPLMNEEFPPDWSAEQRAAREALRLDLHQELARRFPRGRLVVASRSGHHVHHDEPELVVAEIRRLVETTRASALQGAHRG